MLECKQLCSKLDDGVFGYGKLFHLCGGKIGQIITSIRQHQNDKNVLWNELEIVIKKHGR
jgi:hypothetical protein